MIGYTSDVEEYYGDRDGVVSHIYASWYSANEVLDRSDVDDVWLNIIHAEKVDYIEDPNDMGIDLNHLSERDGVMDELLDRRDELGADLVCLFRSGSAGEASGIAYTLTNELGSPQNGFSVVDARAAISNYTFQHEIGHNMGAAHDRENADIAGLFEYSYGYRLTSESFGEVRTVMAYAPGKLIPMFSNPRLDAYGGVMGVPEGQVDAADNSKTLGVTAPIVAAYRDEVERVPWITTLPEWVALDHNGDGEERVEVWGIVDFPYRDIVSWEWSWDGGSVAGEFDERYADGIFPVGENLVTIKATDIEGRIGTKTMRVTIAEYQPIKEVVGGSGLSVFVREDGSVNAFGDLLTRGEVDNYPHKLFSIEEVAAVALGYEHVLFLKSDGSLWGSGSDTEGQLGLNSEPPGFREYLIHKDPVKSMVSDVAMVAAGGKHTLVVKSDGSLWGVGDNSYGQLGLGSENEFRVFTQIVPSDVIDVSAEGENSMFVMSDGSLWGMGRNSEGQLGTGSRSQHRFPREIHSEGVRSVSVAYSHASFLKEDGSMWSMGSNEFGQLGDGTNLDRWLPTRVIASGVAQIESGGTSSFAIMEDGSAWGMGNNLSGQLGEGSMQNQTEPTKVHYGNVQAISSGDSWTHFLRSDGALWGAGSNNYGTLGTGVEDFETRALSVEIVPAAVEMENAVPLSVPGSNIAILDEDLDGVESVALDGFSSHDDWQIVSWNWAWDGGTALGSKVVVSLPMGVTEVTLTVRDNKGEESSAAVTVEILGETEIRDWLGEYFTEEAIEGFDGDLLSLDADNDGLTNDWEWRLGLDPSDRDSSVRVSLIPISGQLRINVTPYRSQYEYELLSSENASSWEYVSSAQSAVEEALMFEVLYLDRFYRVRIEKP